MNYGAAGESDDDKKVEEDGLACACRTSSEDTKKKEKGGVALRRLSAVQQSASDDIYYITVSCRREKNRTGKTGVQPGLVFEEEYNKLKSDRRRGGRLGCSPS